MTAQMVRMHRTLRIWLAMFFLLMASQSLMAQQIDTTPEFLVKEAYLYNFSQFVEWPTTAFSHDDSPFVICVMGKDQFGAALLSLQKHTYKSRPIVINYPKTVAEARNCQILYVDDVQKTSLRRDLEIALGNAPILTVSSGDDAITSGICIGFVLQNGKVRWDLNLETVRRKQLKMSAKLIEIAVAIVGDTAR
jgi:hypothetical protein